LDIPKELHRRLHEVAIQRGCSARQLVLESIRAAVGEQPPQAHRRKLSLVPAIVPSRGKPFDYTNEQLYDFIEFP